MGAIMALLLTGMVGVGVWKLLTDPVARKRYAAEFNGAPGASILVMTWVACILVFFWGVFVPVFGTIKIPIFGTKLELWSLGGIGSAVGFVVWLAVAQYKSKIR